MPPPWQPTDPCQLSLAPIVVPLKHVPFGVTIVAVLQLSLAGWAKIKATENKKKPSVNDFFKLKNVSKIIFSTTSQGLHF